MRKIKVLIACGGTGGHVFPAIALSDSLRRKCADIDILFAGAFGANIQNRLSSSGYNFRLAEGCGMPHFFNIIFFQFIFKTFLAFKNAVNILKDFSPDAVVSMGSFSGAPFALAARFKNVPVIIHEQNFIPGRANRLCAYFADRIAISFEGTRRLFPGRLERKIVSTGNPVRRWDKKVSCGAAEKNSRFKILVMGGSQGSHNINEAFLKAAEKLDKEKFSVLHITGSADIEHALSHYRKIGLSSRVEAFLNQMQEAYSVCDLLICRAGATTIAEIAVSETASILIPYPWAGAHQRANARPLQEAGAALIFEEKDLTADGLARAINAIWQDQPRLAAMRQAVKAFARPDAADNLANEVINIARNTLKYNRNTLLY